jgi:hypothetical protein
MVDTEEFNPPNLTKIPQGKFLNDINDLYWMTSPDLESLQQKVKEPN